VITLFFIQMLASAGYVSFRSMQVINITNNQWWMILPTSLCIALCEVYVIHMIATSDLDKVWLVLSTGTGGAIGCFVAMWVSRIFKKESSSSG